MGMFVHLVLDGAWTRTDLFWWPFSGWSLAGEELPSIDHGLAIVVLEEMIGAAAVAWWWTRFRLFEPRRRLEFVRSGRVGRDLAGPSRPR
jgi:hypothetical protein